MNIEYILYAAVIIVTVSFMALIYLFTVDMKKRMVNNKIEKFSIKSGKKVTQQELDRILQYIERNKKYLTSSAYKMGMYKIDKARARM